MNTQMSKLIEGLQRNYKCKSNRVPTYVLVSAQRASFLFFNHLNDLFVGESLLHLSVLLLSGLYTKLEETWGAGHILRASGGQ